VIRVESTGSYWDVDDVLMRYRRWPKGEGPRINPNHAPKSTHLEDGVWHEMDAWYVDRNEPYLCLRYTGAVVGIQAPLEEDEWKRLLAVTSVERLDNESSAATAEQL
jgi:hypothetical protein